MKSGVRMSQKLAKASAVLFVLIVLSLENAVIAGQSSDPLTLDQRHDRKVKVIAVSSDQVNNDYKTDLISEETSTQISAEQYEETLGRRKDLPFFVAEDGRSIQLPPKDIIYNKDTGEIMIRNRNNERVFEDGSTSDESIRASIMKQNYYNIKPETIGFKNLQGFVIQDGSDEAITMSAEDDTTETSTELFLKPYNKYERTAKQSMSEEYDRPTTDLDSKENHDFIDSNDNKEHKIKVQNPDAERKKEHKGSSIKEDDINAGNVNEPLENLRMSNRDLEDDTLTTQQSDPLDALRSYLEDIYLRGPIAVIVDMEEESLAMTREAWKAMERVGGILNLTDLILIAYEKSGISLMSHHKATNPREVADEVKSFNNILNSLRPSKESGNSLNAIMKAYRLLPYDSAIFLFSNRKAPDWSPNDERTLIRYLLSKRIKLYVICGGDGCEGSAARASGGSRVELQSQEAHRRRKRHEPSLEVYYDGSEEANDVNAEFEQQETIVLKNNLNGMHTTTIPIDSTIRSITISITGNPENATLTSPTNETINILDELSVSQYSKGSEILALHPTAAVRLMFNKEEPKIIDWGTLNNDTSEEENETDSVKIEPETVEINPIVGAWSLFVKGHNSSSYDVQIDVESSIKMTAKILTQYSGPRAGDKNLKISVKGPLGSIKEVFLVDQHENKIAPIPLYKYHDYVDSDVTDVQTLRMQEAGIVSKVVAIPTEVSKDKEFYVQISGKNNKGEHFARMSQELRLSTDNDESEQVEDEFARISERSSAENIEDGIDQGFDVIETERSDSTPARDTQIDTATSFNGLPMTLLQIGAASKLYGTPGLQMQLHFEVTNNRPNPVFYRFGAKDDQYFLRSMNPTTQWVNAGQTVNVVVNIGITSNAENNVRDTITFTASGLEQTVLSAYVYVDTEKKYEYDRTRPYLDYSYRGDCIGYLDDSDCAKKTWGLDIKARDTDSGIMRILSSPQGIVYNSNFIAGTRDEIYARYSASCCSKRVTISAIDLNGNAYSYDLNVAYYLTPAMIAAIVLGVLLFIALLIVVICLIRWGVRRRQNSRDIPSYRTQPVQ